MDSRFLRLGLTALATLLLCVASATHAAADAAADEVLAAVPLSSFPLPASARCGAPACCPEPEDPCCKRLKFSVSLVGWLSAMDGTVGSGANDFDVDLSLGDVVDLLDKLDGLLQGNVRVDYGKWWARLGFSYMDLASDSDVRLNPGPGAGVSIPVSANITQAYYELVAGYNLKNAVGPRIGGCCSSLRYDVFAGVRWADMELAVTTPGVTRGGSQDWLDPVVGGAVTWDLKNRWSFDVDADIGGFGVNSSLTWRVRLGAMWSPTRWFGVVGGWLFLDYDYTTGSGASRFQWDVLTHGPFLGVNFRF